MIVIDANIALAEAAFKEFGDIALVAGRQITQSSLQTCTALLVRSVTRVDRSLLQGTPVRFVGTATAGQDHIDRDYLATAGIDFSSAPGSNARSVAEYVMAALVQLCKKNGRRPESMTMGIIGAGHVGSLVQQFTQALGLRCLVNDPPLFRAGLIHGHCSLNALLDESDIVTLHVPLIRHGHDATFHMANKHFFDRMKKGAFFVNASRGDVVQESDLRQAREKLGGIVCDVWHHEPGISLDTLSVVDIATPHIAGYSFDAKVLATRMIHKALCGHCAHEPAFSFENHIHMSMVSLDLHIAADPIAEALLSAYPIMADDSRLREMLHLHLGEQNRAKHFDALRKNYHQRREFGHFRVLGAQSAQAPLRSLGFQVS